MEKEKNDNWKSLAAKYGMKASTLKDYLKTVQQELDEAQGGRSRRFITPKMREIIYKTMGDPEDFNKQG